MTMQWAADQLDMFFDISRRGSTVGTELRAGLTSFLTLSYLLLVNPQVLAKAGMNPEDVVTAMCLSCGIPTILSGLFGNLPFVMAPGLGLSAYLTYGLVALDDSGAPTKGMTWQETMGCVLIAGGIMSVLTVTDLVTKSMKFVPGHIKLATIIGIGLLLAAIGFESAGVIVKGELADNIVTAAAWPTWTALGGLMFIAVLNYWDIPAAIVTGVIGVSVVLWYGRSSWPSKFVEFPMIDDTWMKFSVSTLQPATAVPAVMTFLLVALFDCSGCLIGLSRKAGIIGHVDDPVPGGSWALIACSLGTIISACTGNSPIIIAVECTAGIVEGGRTGLTAVTAAMLFFLSLFFAPLFGAVPTEASAPVLVLIGSMMMQDVGEIKWSDSKIALPAFLTIALMPLSHSISNGIWFGLPATILLHIFTHPALGRLFGARTQGDEGLLLHMGDDDDDLP